MITKEQKKEIVVKYGNDARNTGDEKVQVALLTARINDLQNQADDPRPRKHQKRQHAMQT